MAYIALALIGAGASWGRAPDKQEAIDKCARYIVADWSSLYDVKGKPCDINVFDIGDADSVRMGHDGVTILDGDEPRQVERLELVNVTLPKKLR